MFPFTRQSLEINKINFDVPHVFLWHTFCLYPQCPLAFYVSLKFFLIYCLKLTRATIMDNRVKFIHSSYVICCNHMMMHFPQQPIINVEPLATT